MKPSLRVNLARIYENAKRVLEACSRCGITVTAITKGVCAEAEITKLFWESGYRSFGDSRLQNLKVLRGLYPEAEITLIRPPMLSQISELPLYADIVFVSMPNCLTLLDIACKESGLKKTLGIVLLIEMGDLRDGIMPDEVDDFLDIIKSCDNLRLHGVAANFGCFGAICPSPDKLQQLVEIKQKLEKMGYGKLLCSGGSTSSLLLLEERSIPVGINSLRIGEAILLGIDVTNNREISWLNKDTMVLEAEIIELRRKPSVPFGKSGLDAFGNTQFFENRGERLRGIAAIGKQDVNIAGLTPLLDGVEILGASGDHLICDLELVKDSKELYLGNSLKFAVNYSAMLALFTSKYVSIDFV
jgi:predicted amino acid racemase